MYILDTMDQIPAVIMGIHVIYVKNCKAVIPKMWVLARRWAVQSPLQYLDLHITFIKKWRKQIFIVIRH